MSRTLVMIKMEKYVGQARIHGIISILLHNVTYHILKDIIASNLAGSQIMLVCAAEDAQLHIRRVHLRAL